MIETILNELERDALTEIVNISVSRAASSLRKMVGEQVLLTIPAIETLSQKTAAHFIGQEGAEGLVGIRQRFKGKHEGAALLMLSETKGAELARAILGEELSADEVAKLADEVLAETGNIILNACLGSIANMLKRTVAISFPEFVRGGGRAFFEVTEDLSEEQFVLLLYVNFSVRSRDLRGYITIVMDLPALLELKALIAEFVEDALRESA